MTHKCYIIYRRADGLPQDDGKLSGEENCNEHLLIAPSGEVLNARDAERRMKMKKTEDLSDGWHKVNGLWYCQSHKIE